MKLNMTEGTFGSEIYSHSQNIYHVTERSIYDPK